jgi:hypothetical protein
MRFEMIDIEKENRDMEAIREAVAEHQIETFGHVLTREELDEREEEYRKERAKRFEGLTDEESAELMQRETDEWLKEWKEKYGYNSEDLIYDENLSEEENRIRRERGIAASMKAFSSEAKEVERLSLMRRSKKTA